MTLIVGTEKTVSAFAIEPLLIDYIKRRRFFISAAVSDTEIIGRWKETQTTVWDKFKKEVGVSEDMDKATGARKRLSRADLEIIKDDVDLVIRIPSEKTGD